MTLIAKSVLRTTLCENLSRNATLPRYYLPQARSLGRAVVWSRSVARSVGLGLSLGQSLGRSLSRLVSIGRSVSRPSLYIWRLFSTSENAHLYDTSRDIFKIKVYFLSVKFLFVGHFCIVSSYPLYVYIHVNCTHGRTSDYVVLGLPTLSQRREFVFDSKWMQSVYVTLFLATS